VYHHRIAADCPANSAAVFLHDDEVAGQDNCWSSTTEDPEGHIMPRTLLLLVLAIELALQSATSIHAEEPGGQRLDRFGDPLPTGALARLGTLRFHRCRCAAYSPDGKIIVTGDRDWITLRESATGKIIRELTIDDRDLTGFLFSHDGKKLAAVCFGGSSAHVWDLATFKKVLDARMGGGSGGGDWSSAAAFSADDKTLSAATSSTVFVWDVTSGKKLKEFPFRIKDERVRGRIVAFSEDGKVAATQREKKVCLWDTQTGKLLHDLDTVDAGETLKFSRDGKLLVVTGHRHWMNLFSVESGKKLPSLAVAERVVSLAFSPDGKTLAAASNETIYSSSTEGEQIIQLWDLTRPQTTPVKLPASGIHSVMFSPDGKTLAWTAHGQSICFMDRATGKDVRPTASHLGAIKSLVYLPDGKRIVSASDDGAIRIWDSAIGESLSVLQGHTGEINGLALYPNGKLLASCGRDGTFRLWDLESSKSLAVLNDGHSYSIAAFSADGKQLASGGRRGRVVLRDPATGIIIEELETNPDPSLAFSPDGKTLAVLSDHDQKLHLLDPVSKQSSEIPIKGGVSSVAYSPDGRFLAVGCDETLLLVDTGTNGVRRRLPGHYNRRGCVVFSPDSRYLASVSDGYGEVANRSIRVFELATGTEIHSFKRELPIFAVAFSPDGSKLAVGGEDATALILDLTNLTGKKRREQLTENELSAHLESLSALDAEKAYEARADLLHAPKSTVPFLAKRLQPAPVLDAKRVEALIRSLDSKAFRERDEATKELEQLGELVREPLRKALADKPSPEMGQRLRGLLGKQDHYSPAQLRNLRAIEILEGIGTPEAIGIIERLTEGNPDGLLTIESRTVIVRRKKRSAPLPPNPVAREQSTVEVPAPSPGPVLPDREGDPMPAGAIARLGSARWRLANEPRRIIVSSDGAMLAAISVYSGAELFDSRTGRSIERLGAGFYNWGLDLRMGVALSPDWRKVAALEVGDGGVSVLAVSERGKKEKVKIDYGRKKELYPPVPEEVEESGSVSRTTFEYLAAADFAPDGKTLVASIRFEWQCEGGNSVKKEVKETHLVAWNASSGKEIWKSPPTPHLIHTILCSPDGRTVAVVDEAGVGFWDLATGRELRRWPSKEALFSARYSPDRAWLATGSKNEILLWESATGKVRQRLALPGDQIKAVAFSPDGKLLAGGSNKTIRFWDAQTGKAQGDCSAFANPVQAVAFSGGKTLFSGHEKEHVLRRWDVAGRKPSGEFNSPIMPVLMLSFSRDSRTILASSMEDDFYLWEAETGKPVPLPKNDDVRLNTEWLASSGQAALLRCEEGFGSQLAMLLTGKFDRLDQIPGFLGSSVDGQRLLIESEKEKMPCLTVVKAPKEKIKDRDPRKDNVEREFIWKDGKDVHAALSPDGKTVAAAGSDVVCFFDVITGRERRHTYPTNVKAEFLFRTQSIKFSADGSRIVLAGGDGKVRILAVKDGRRLAEFATKSRNLTGLALSPDGQTLLTASFNSPVRAWEVATGQMVHKLELTTYLFSPNNCYLAGSGDSLKIFDLYSGRVIRECKMQGAGFGNFAFSPSSKLLAASCSDTTIVVWPTSPTEVKASKPFDEKSLALVLETGTAPEAYEAIGRMIADPERTLPFLERRLRPAPKVDRKKEQDEKLPAISAEDILHIRAIQALERIGTKQARQLLEKLAQGAEISPRTRAASEALRRMEVQRID
jgi:WD40 repeat protein